MKEIDSLIIFTRGFYEAVLLLGSIILFAESLKTDKGNNIMRFWAVAMLYTSIVYSPYCIFGILGKQCPFLFNNLVSLLNVSIIGFLPLASKVLMQKDLTLKDWIKCFTPVLISLVALFTISESHQYIYDSVLFIAFLYLVIEYGYSLYILKKWDRNLLNTYSDVAYKQTKWFRRLTIPFVWLCIILAVLYFFPSLYWVRLLYYLLAISIFTRFTLNAMSQEVFAEESATDDEPVKDDQDTAVPVWADKLIKVMEIDKIYQDQNLDLHKLSLEVGVNRTYLSKYINNSLSTTFYDYINDYRLKEACQLLKASELSQEAIASKCGFKSRSALFNAFKSKYGMTPSKWKTTN